MSVGNKRILRKGKVNGANIEEFVRICNEAYNKIYFISNKTIQ